MARCIKTNSTIGNQVHSHKLKQQMVFITNPSDGKAEIDV